MIGTMTRKAKLGLMGLVAAGGLTVAAVGGAGVASADGEIRTRTLVRPEGTYVITEQCNTINLDGRNITDCRVVSVIYMGGDTRAES